MEKLGGYLLQMLQEVVEIRTSVLSREGRMDLWLVA